MAFVGCRFCSGLGCVACPGEKETAFERVSEPIFVADKNNTSDLELLSRVLTAGSVEDVEREAALASVIQALRKAARGADIDDG